MAALTVRNLDPDLIRHLHVRAAEHGVSADAEHREILRAALVGPATAPGRKQAAEGLAAFRARTAGRGAAPVAELVEQSRVQRLQPLLDRDERA